MNSLFFIRFATCWLRLGYITRRHWNIRLNCFVFVIFRFTSHKTFSRAFYSFRSCFSLFHSKKLFSLSCVCFSKYLKHRELVTMCYVWSAVVVLRKKKKSVWLDCFPFHSGKKYMHSLCLDPLTKSFFFSFLQKISTTNEGKVTRGSAIFTDERGCVLCVASTADSGDHRRIVLHPEPEHAPIATCTFVELSGGCTCCLFSSRCLRRLLCWKCRI